jgi:RNase P subunit RPR2
MSVRFYSEYLSNINTLSITLFIKGVPPDLSINTFSLAFLSENDNSKKNIITFPFKIIPSSLRISETEDTVILKLKTEKEWFNVKMTSINDMPITYDSKILKNINCLYCNKCGSQLSILKNPVNSENISPKDLSVLTSFKRVVDLPSDHWFEMMDCWLCVPSDISRFEGQIGIGSMAAKINELLLGRTFIILHPDNILENSYIQKNYEVKQTLVYIWKEILCKHCEQKIGFSLVNTSENDKIVAIKLHKYKITIDLFSNKKKEIVRFNSISFIECFVADLFEYANSRASYKFIIKNEKAEPMGLIWLLNWNVYITTNNFGSENITSKAVKLLFIDCINDNSPLTNQWKNDTQIEVLEYEHQCCIELLNYLQQSQQAIPKEQQRFNNFNVGLITYTIKS